MNPSERIRAVLRDSFLFSKLSDIELDTLIGLASSRHFGAEQVVFTRGSISDRLFAVLTGRVRVVSYSDSGNEIIFRILDPGDAFGEIGLLDEGPRTATAIATDPSELLVIERRALLGRLRTSPELLLKLLESMALRLRSTTELVEDILFLNVPARLARKLLELAESHGTRTPEGIRIELHLPQEVLGNLVGTSRVSINQQMRAWKGRGLVRVERACITLLDVSALEGLAAGEVP